LIPEDNNYKHELLLRNLNTWKDYDDISTLCP